jgi:hypothetical protein
MTPAEERDRRIVSGAPVVFGQRMMLAHEALLHFSGECIDDAWPDVSSVLRFARCYDVDPQVLGALVGIVSWRLSPKGKLIWCDAQRHPEHVHRTTPNRLARRVQSAYGCYVAAASLAEAARAKLN